MTVVGAGQVVAVALRVHARPEPVVTEHRQLLVVREPDERTTLEDAALVLVDVVEELSAEEEVAAVDPPLAQLRLLVERGDALPFEGEVAEAGGWAHRRDGGEAAVARLSGE